MNTRKLMAVALCAAACVTTTAFAEYDFGIESASPVKIADPVNPQPGMVFNAYGIWLSREDMENSISSLPSKSALKTAIDKTDKFSFAMAGDTQASVLKWDGLIKCKRAGVYTFVLCQDGHQSCDRCGYSFSVNGKVLIPRGERQVSCDVNLNVGWNTVSLVSKFHREESPFTMTFKPKGSLSEPRPIAPKDLFHDQKPEEDW